MGIFPSFCYDIQVGDAHVAFCPMRYLESIRRASYSQLTSFFISSESPETSLVLVDLPEDAVDKGEFIAGTAYSDLCKTTRRDSNEAECKVAIKRLRLQSQEEKDNVRVSTFLLNYN